MDNIYSDIKKVFTKDDKEQYCIVSVYVHQYAAGITGFNRNYTIFLKGTNEGWSTKGEAKGAALANGIKPVHKKGKGNEGYGDVGSTHKDIFIMSISEAKQKYPHADIKII